MRRASTSVANNDGGVAAGDYSGVIMGVCGVEAVPARDR